MTKSEFLERADWLSYQIKMIKQTMASNRSGSVVASNCLGAIALDLHGLCEGYANVSGEGGKLLIGQFGQHTRKLAK